MVLTQDHKKMRKCKIVLVAACLGAAVGLTACDRNKRPQKELTFTAPLTDELRNADTSLNPALRARIEHEEDVARNKRLEVEVAKLPSDAPFAGLGFTKGNSRAFVVLRDGTAGCFTRAGAYEPLDQLVDRIDRILIPETQAGRVVGVSAHGTLASWNFANLSQQLLLYPQQTTFKRKRLFDVQPVSSGRSIVTASESGLLEVWSLSSGQKIGGTKLSNTQPRQIAQNSSRAHVIFGTNKGQVMVWRGGRSAVPLYTHTGPLLKLHYLPKKRMVASVGKDGQFILFNLETKQTVFRHVFRKANYTLEVSRDERFVIVAPAVGAALRLDLTSMSPKTLRPSSSRYMSQVSFGANSAFAISQHNARGLNLWNIARSQSYRGGLEAKSPGRAISFRVAKNTNIVAVLTNKNYIEYWDIAAKRYLGPAFRSRVADVADYTLSPDGKWLLIGLNDGRLMRQRVSYDEKKPIEVF